MARLIFSEPFDIRDLPATAPAARGSGLVFEEGATRLLLAPGEEEAGYRPKVAAAGLLDRGEIAQAGALVARIEDAGFPALLARDGSGATLARALLAGDDRITGSAGADRLPGFGGDDRITGGRGADVMTGGGGADLFRFAALSDSPASDPDRITDFRSGHDRIDLRGIDAAHGTPGDQAFDFLGAREFSGAAGELRWTGAALEADVNGDGRADFALRLGASHMPGADDLLL
ncbi:M10 family metallopeptidase C-terminal domain-containing protein [Amaricoccus solimangrovi]|uniref:Peptidase M10 serralysin C-terminal domain-containing protein n=1 Tax=Amaricoccus solimangrovi TaxID=2589815 RepID=A0A501WZ59_9RHOB|nr:M10 family metallopeptidase C-terminal domain-containing protein [Amaricoccus solimangrovi]TPE53605.1 hypothetical protein FJM51_00715 [Amaricoccus solimangrovi]